jgi:predicted RNase H-like HicB family nuclease
MLTPYIQAAMRQATYEILEDGTFYAEIPGFQGVYANTETLEDCREELQEVLEGWIVLGLRLGHTLPVINDLQLNMIPDDYELRDEYDLSKMTIVPKGRYAPERRVGQNVVLLAPDVVQAFPTDEAVNEALRLVMEMVKVSGKYRQEMAQTEP